MGKKNRGSFGLFKRKTGKASGRRFKNKKKTHDDDDDDNGDEENFFQNGSNNIMDKTAVDEMLKTCCQWKTTKSPSSVVFHLIVLIPGVLAPKSGMEQIRIALQTFADQVNHSNIQKELAKSTTSISSRVIVYKSISNSGTKSAQGIRLCGQRLAIEINELIQYIVDSIVTSRKTTATSTGNIQVNLSLIGNSFGGVIGRAALPDIDWSPTVHTRTTESTTESTTITVSVKPKLFSTTNTPHLGSKDDGILSKLPFPIRYPMEIISALAIGQSGKDLFRWTTHIEELASQPKYLDPLQNFQKRIAYANAYKTDLQVSTETAVFITASSTNNSIHYIVGGDMAMATSSEAKQQPTTTTTKLSSSSQFFFETDTFPFVVQAYRTPQTRNKRLNGSSSSSDDDDDNDNKNHNNNNNNITKKCNWMRQHCEKLDSLGWTKVFCDIRSELPTFRSPSSVLSGCCRFHRRRWNRQQEHHGKCCSSKGSSSVSSSSSSFDGFPSTSKKKSSGETAAAPLPPLPQEEEFWTASQLYQEYCSRRNGISGEEKEGEESSGQLKTWYVPMAHPILVANNNTGDKGLPFVKEYAKRIMNDVLAED